MLTRAQAIHLHGRIFDRVESVVHDQPYNIIGPYASKPMIGFRLAQEMRAWERTCLGLVVSHPEYPTGEGHVDAFWRTLVCNREAKGTAAPADLHAAYNSWSTGFRLAALTSEVYVSIANRLQPTTDSNPWSPWGKAYRYICSRIDIVHEVWVGFRLAWYAVELEREMEPITRFDAAFGRFAPTRKFFRSEKGYIGWVPQAAQEGDLLCLFENCWLPFAIRPGPKGYRLIGEAYVHGVMDEQPGHVLQTPFTTIKLV